MTDDEWWGLAPGSDLVLACQQPVVQDQKDENDVRFGWGHPGRMRGLGNRNSCTCVRLN